MLLFTLFGLFYNTSAEAAGLSGTFTVCKSGCNATTADSVIKQLKTHGLSGPVTIDIKAGTYNESLEIKGISGLSASNTLTIKGAGKYSTKLSSKGGSTGAVIALDSAKYVHIENIGVENSANTSTYSCIWVKTSEYITVKNCLMSIVFLSPNATNAVCLYIEGSSYCNYENNIIKGGETGIYNQYGLYQSTYLNEGYSTYKNNRITGARGSAIKSEQGRNNKYINNYVDSALAGRPIGNYGIYSMWEMGAQYLGNTVKATNFGRACLFSGGSGYDSDSFLVINNMFGSPVNSFTSTVDLVFYWNFDAKFGFYHNTLHNVVHNGSGFGGPAIDINATASAGIDIRNNIFSSANGATTINLNIPSSTINLDYNNYYTTSATWGVVGITQYKSFTSLRNSLQLMALEKHIQNVEPSYISSNDLHLASNKPAPFAKYITGIDTDIDGDLRCKAFPTTGADESQNGKQKITASFTSPDTVYVNSPSVFTNGAAADELVNTEWYINGKLVSTERNLTGSKFSGPADTVMLISKGCENSDTAISIIKPILPKSVPTTNFIASTNFITRGQTVVFTDMSTPGPSSWKWEISPVEVFTGGVIEQTFSLVQGKENDQNISVRFNHPGKYKVCLTASNALGKGNTECKIDYIEVSEAVNMCSTKFTREASGYLYDDGGPQDNVGGFKNCNMIIAPCADTAYLVFNKFDLNCQADYVRIYDGTDATGKPLHCTGPSYNGFTGSSGPIGCSQGCIPINSKGIPDTLVSTSGKFYIEYETFQPFNYTGFEAYWWSKPRVDVQPTALFSAADTFCTKGIVAFENLSTGKDLEYYWDLDGDINTIEVTGANLQWQYQTAGKVDVSLIVLGCGGMDTFTKSIYIKNPPVPFAKFTTVNSRPTLDDVVFLTEETEECVEEFAWSFTHSKGTGKAVFVNGTSYLSPNPQVKFTETGCYSVKLRTKNMTGSDSLQLNCYIEVKDPYCAPKVTSLNPDISISSVELADLKNAGTELSKGYSNFITEHSAKLEEKGTYPLIIKRPSNKNHVNLNVWIDWNQDGDFSDLGEAVGAALNASSASWTMPVSVPLTARLGATIMRIAINHSNHSNKVCGPNNFGEFEDYRIYVYPDLTKPDITLIGSDTIYTEQGYTFTDPGATAYDNISGDISSRITVTQNPVFDNLIPRAYIFRYNVSDSAFNEAYEKRRVVIVTPDKTPPTIILKDSDTMFVKVNTTFSDPGVLNATDLVDADLTDSVKTSGSINTSVIDTQFIYYSVTDKSGNTAAKMRTIIIIDDVAPIITLAGADTLYHQLNTAFTDPGYSVIDNYNNNLIVNVNGTVDISKPGIYILTYSAKDASGNEAMAKQRIVIVRDNASPMITLNSNDSVVVDVNTVYTDLGYTISGNSSKIITVDTSGTFLTTFSNSFASETGMFTIIYTAEDANGNKAFVTRRIYVTDRFAPVITLNGEEDIILCRWQQYQDAGYTVSDNYNSVSEITIDTLGTFESATLPGFYTISYRATDAAKNTSVTAKRTIWVRTPEECGTTGLDGADKKALKLNVYPNPSTGMVWLETDLSADASLQISVTNLYGQDVLVKTEKSLLQNQLTLDLSAQASGVYIIKVSSGDNIAYKRVVISK